MVSTVGFHPSSRRSTRLSHSNYIKKIMDQEKRDRYINDLAELMKVPEQDTSTLLQEAYKNAAKMNYDKTDFPASIYSFQALASAIKAGGFIVGSYSAGSGISFSNIPKVHATAEQARAECRRLSNLSPGKAYIFVKFCGAELVPLTQAVSI